MLDSGQTVPLHPSQIVPTPPPSLPPTTPSRADSAALRLHVLEFPQRYDEVLTLRRLAFGDTGSSTTQPDPRDLDASLLAVSQGTQLVATLRLAPPQPGPLFHATTRFAGPLDTLPERETLLESSRACIHPDHRGQGLCWLLAAEMVLTARDQGKSHLVGGVARHLLGFWTRCGYQTTDITYGYPGDPIDRYRVVLLDVARLLDRYHQGDTLEPALHRALATRLAERDAEGQK